MRFGGVGTGGCFVKRLALLVPLGLLAVTPMPAQVARKPTPTTGCKVQASNYLGWKAEEISNQWVKLEVVPQLGGRLMQVTFGGHDFLYVNPELNGKVIPLGTKEGDRNYGGDKIWPLPEGNQDEQHWSQGGELDGRPFILRVLSRGARCAVRLTGQLNPDIGQRYIRDISIGPDSPAISFHVVMQNMSGYPQTWSEQTITEYPMSDPAGSDHFNTKFWGVTPLNAVSGYPNGYHVRSGPQENEAFSSSDGMFRVHWNNIEQEVWIDSTQGWLAAVDGTAGYTMVERRHFDPTAEYPGKATIIFYSSGEHVRRARPTGAPSASPQPAGQNQSPGLSQSSGPHEGPFMEAEVNSPMVELAPGESYAMDTQWYPTRMGEDFKTTTYSGVVGVPLTATRTPAGLVLAGSFGVFYAGDLVAHYYGRGGDGGTAKLMSVTPVEPVQLQITLQAPPNTGRVSVHLVDLHGVDRGPLGEVLVNPPPARRQ
jgi:hypothetical protein